MIVDLPGTHSLHENESFEAVRIQCIWVFRTHDHDRSVLLDIFLSDMGPVIKYTAQEDNVREDLATPNDVTIPVPH